MKTFVVGKDCDAWCTRCRMDLAHTIVAMVDGLPVQVICNTCGGKHKYRPPKSEGGSDRSSKGAGARRGRTTKAEREAAAAAARRERQWADLIAHLGGVDPRRYNVRQDFALKEPLRHSKFGIGFVIEQPAFNRAKVLFEDGERTLVINHGKRPEA